VIASEAAVENIGGVPTVKGVVCGYDRKYHPPVECEVVVPKCAPYDAPVHGSVFPTGEVEEGECVDIVCDDKYQLVPGSKSRACCVEVCMYVCIHLCIYVYVYILCMYIHIYMRDRGGRVCGCSA